MSAESALSIERPQLSNESLPRCSRCREAPRSGKHWWCRQCQSEYKRAARRAAGYVARPRAARGPSKDAVIMTLTARVRELTRQLVESKIAFGELYDALEALQSTDSTEVLSAGDDGA